MNATWVFIAIALLICDYPLGALMALGISLLVGEPDEL